ncbi:MAG: serine--tRNA ligase [Candidatus Kerfeldbacteria bacterium]|nr:serine--tRNA ligase [Candidatus Kerfeldbacteria bacterium]
MIDIELLRSDPLAVSKKLKSRGLEVELDQIISADNNYRKILQTVEALRAERKSKGSAAAKDESARAALKEMKARETALSKELEEQKAALQARLSALPNLPADDVPAGSATKNEILRTVGQTKPGADYLTVAGDLIDLERAAKVSGSRFAYLKGQLVELEFALVQYVLDRVVPAGFTPVVPPVIMNAEMMRAVGAIEGLNEQEMYHLRDDDQYLVGTAEHALMAMHSNEILAAEQLPIRYLAFSTCFRREAGSYGKDTKGILRVHQFDKLEMVSLTTPDQSDAEHEKLLGLVESLVGELGLPYRVVKLAAGDMGFAAARTYDIETWLPGEGTYRETHSCSTTRDCQTRRLNIRSRDGQTVPVCHGLNSTAFAIGRTLIALVEHYQRPDGGFDVPPVLAKYLRS